MKFRDLRAYILEIDDDKLMMVGIKDTFGNFCFNCIKPMGSCIIYEIEKCGVIEICEHSGPVLISNRPYSMIKMQVFDMKKFSCTFNIKQISRHTKFGRYMDKHMQKHKAKFGKVIYCDICKSVANELRNMPLLSRYYMMNI